MVKSEGVDNQNQTTPIGLSEFVPRLPWSNLQELDFGIIERFTFEKLLNLT
jgi:hypothetical protein